MVTRLSPMARSVRHPTEITAQLQERGIDLVVLKQGIGTITPAGRFTFHVLGAMDEMFAGLISEGTRERLATFCYAGCQQAGASGRAAGPAVPPQVAACDAAVMDIISLSDAPAYDSNRVVAQPFLEGSQSNVRLIRLSPGQALPPHTHGSSDLMIFAVEGEGTLDTDDGTVPFGAGSLAFYRGDEELRVANTGQAGLTLLAFLSPSFPPRSGT